MKRASLNRAAVGLVALALVGCGGGGGEGPTQPPPGGTNHNPTVNLNIDNLHLAYGGTATATVTASDQDGDQLSFSWVATLGSVSTSGPSATAATFTAGNQWGQASVTVTASDGKGGSTQATAQTYIRNPDPPYFGLGPVASTSTSCNGFALQITSPDNVIITHLDLSPCGGLRNFAPGINLTAGVPYVISDPDCIGSSCGGGPVLNYEVIISGQRAEPDGGSFYYRCSQWDPDRPTVCH